MKDSKNNLLTQKIQKTIFSYQMFETGERVLVAVSGGPDSVALLRALCVLNVRYCLDIAVAHLDHGLRKNSKLDLEFVRGLAQSLNLPFYSGVIDWKKEKRIGSLEDDLRRRRYDFLFGVAKKIRAKKIVLGHTKDDQAETALMRVIRGSGLYGLSAILPKRSVANFDIVRPLIETERKDVLFFLKKIKMRFRIDESNLDEKFFRNKIRKKLLPYLLKEYNPNIKETLSSLVLLVGADYSYLQSQADDFLSMYLDSGAGVFKISLQALSKIDIALKRLVLRRVLEKVLKESAHQGAQPWTFRHSREIEDLILHRPYGSRVHLPYGVTVLKKRNKLLIY
jgi:tRNA(Ile)-lysidine synthase